jgi:hypothetical protein
MFRPRLTLGSARRVGAPRALTISLMTLALTACGGDLIAPEGPTSNAFLQRIDSNCGRLSLGNQPLNYLLDMESDDSAFIDEASKLAAGLVDQETFASDINAFYPTGNNGAALTCIFAQLEPEGP